MSKQSEKRRPDEDENVIVEYTRQQAIADGVLVPTGFAKTTSGKRIGICFTGHLFEEFNDEKERQKLVEEGLARLRKLDREDSRHRKLRVLRGGLIWVIWDGDGITFLYPEDY